MKASNQNQFTFRSFYDIFSYVLRGGASVTKKTSDTNEDSIQFLSEFRILASVFLTRSDYYSGDE